MLSFDSFARVLQKARNDGAKEDDVVYILKPYDVPQVTNYSSVPEQARVLGYLDMDAVDLHDNWLAVSKKGIQNHVKPWHSSSSADDVSACTAAVVASSCFCDCSSGCDCSGGCF